MVTIGLEACVASPPPVLRRAKFGLLMNQASVDRRFRYAHQVLMERFPGQLVSLFGPQHGLWCEQQDNMVRTPDSREAATGLPIYSLYDERLRPAPETLEPLDCLLVDLQDVGTRVYTYVWTVSYCLEACAEAGVAVVVLDRPNPLGGVEVEGPPLQPQLASFVGRSPVPMRHGLTMGELARFLNVTMDIGAELHVVPMAGWRRRMLFDQTGRVWVPPSPNLPRLPAAQLYPGQVLLEGTNLSEGRGTTTPFELCGAPFVQPQALLAELARFDLPGVLFRPVRFQPMFSKWSGQSCGGLFLHVTDAERFRPYRTTLAILACVRRRWPDQFAWRQPPYEYETKKMPIDLLSGSSALRSALDSERVRCDADLDELAAVDRELWERQTAQCRIYAG